jgi:hypothetical protein
MCRRRARPGVILPDALPEVPPPSRTSLSGGPCCRPLEPDTPVGGPVLPHPELGNQSRRKSTRTGSTYIDGPGIPSAGPVQTKPEPGRRFVPGGRFVPVADAGDAGQDASPKAGLPVPGRGVRSAPGPHWPGQGQAAQDFRPTALSATLGGNRAPGPV